MAGVGHAGRRNADWSPALAMLAASVAAAVAMGSARAGAAPGELLPDLVADPAADVVLATDATDATGPDRLLLRFAGYVHNAGQGAVEVRGSRSSTAAAMTLTQRVFDGAGGWRDAPSSGRLVYEDGDGHGHWHLMHAARYSLWNSARSAEVAPAMKAGFCLEDTEHVDAHGPGARVYGGVLDHRFCEQGRPNVLSVFQGVSPGWRDVYSNRLAFQWVDVSAVQPGSYSLRSDVDPDRVVVESAEGNQAAWAPSPAVIPGYVAQAVDGGAIQPGATATLTLSAQRFGDPGAVAYRIESAPTGGTLDVATGVSTQSATVTYTPRPDFRGTDSFTYSARDTTSGFPLSPAVATATVRVGAPAVPTVRISGAPEQMFAGTSVQLSAAVTGTAAGVQWAVDGAPGGSPVSGSITSGGLYTAPSRPPGAGAVTIAARAAGGAYDERRVRIIPAPPQRPAPTPPSSRPARGRLGAPDAIRIGHRLVLSTVARRAGVVRLTAHAAGRKLGSCSARTPAGRRFICRLRIPRAVASTTSIRVVASLRVKGRVVSVKRRRLAVGPG